MPVTDIGRAGEAVAIDEIGLNIGPARVRDTGGKVERVAAALPMTRSQFGPANAKTYPGLLYCEEGWLDGNKQQYGSVDISRLNPKPPPKTKP